MGGDFDTCTIASGGNSRAPKTKTVNRRRTGKVENNFDWKKFEFIATVQTGLINNGINRSLELDAIQHRAEFSPATVLFHMSEAFRAADMIPESVTARQAAWDFTMWLIHGDDQGVEMPDWFGPPTKEDYDRWNNATTS
jgi:hypothetical protein